MGTAVAQWLRYCGTNWKVAGSIPDGVNGILHSACYSPRPATTHRPAEGLNLKPCYVCQAPFVCGTNLSPEAQFPPTKTGICS